MSNLLINPPSMVQLGYTPHPLGLLFLCAMDDFSDVIDLALDPGQSIEQVMNTRHIEIVGVPIYTPGRKASLRILELAKRHGAYTVAGGPHVGIMHKQLLDNYPFIDACVSGDGEACWKMFTTYKGSVNDGLRKVWTGTIDDLDTLPLPAYERINHRGYPARAGVISYHRDIDLTREPRYSIVFGRGCDGRCNFCSTWWVHGRYRHHGLAWMDRHLRQLWQIGARHLCFQDDCLTVDREASLGLFKLMENYGFSCFGSTRVDHMDDELAQAMAKAGFSEVSFGIESGSQKMLELMRKDTDLSKAFYARDCMRRAGIMFTALMIESYPGETDEMRMETRDFLNKLQPDGYGSLGHTMILPGTQLYRQMRNNGLISDDFWLGDEPYYIYKGGL